MRIALLPLLVALLVPAARAQSVADMTNALVTLREHAVVEAGKTTSVTLASGPVPGAYNGVVLRGFAADGRAEGWIRFPGTDDAWRPLHVVFSATSGTFLAGYRGDRFFDGQPFELRFTVTGGAAFAIESAGVFDQRRDGEERLSGAPGAVVGAPGVISPPDLVRRSEWGARPYRGTPSPLSGGAYQYITFHHAAGFGARTKEEGMEQMRRIQEFHQNTRGWDDIGYHFLVDQSGHVFQGRPFLDEGRALEDAPPFVMGAHTGGANTGNIGLCILGCFHPPAGATCQDVITPAALDSVETMFAFFSERYGIPSARIFGHRDLGTTATECPGDNNYRLLPQIRTDVATLVLTGNQSVGAATLAAEVDGEGVVRITWAFTEDNGIGRYRLERVYGSTVSVVHEGTGPVPDEVVDLVQPGEVVYRLYVTSLSGREQLLAVARLQVEPPEAPVLAGSFPNPFAAQTTIRYFLRQDGLVSLRVYDLAGREVAVLADGYQEGGRWYQQALDGSSLPSGTYFYRLLVEGFAGITFEASRALVRVR